MFDASKRISSLREKYGYSISGLAKKSGIAQSSLSYIEAGKSNPTVDTVQKICDALGITIAEFFEVGGRELSLPIELWDFVAKKENHGFLLAIKEMQERGMSQEFITASLGSLESTLLDVRKQIAKDLASGTQKRVYVAHEAAETPENYKDKEDVASKLERKLSDKKFIPPWENSTK